MKIKITSISLLLFLLIGMLLKPQKKEIIINKDISSNIVAMQISEFEIRHESYIEKNYWENEHKDLIAKKLNKYLGSTLKGKGEYIASYSISVGMDPYLATAVILQETGCYWTCSYLTRVCNNVGGNKGNPGCNGGSYRKFDNIETGIKFSINKLNSYYQKGLTTAKEINPKYAQDKTWYKKVNNYIEKLKNA